MTTKQSPTISGEQKLSDISLRLDTTEFNPSTIEDESAIQVLSRNKFISHHPKAGINPLVDAGGYLFSLIGKLKRLMFHHHLNNLHKELLVEVKNFERLAKADGYSAECILVSRYTLCATLDDIIQTTPWGNQGKWDTYRLLNNFNQESQESGQFMRVLEQIIKNPNLYIDLIEFIYICLSLGFNGGFKNSEMTHTQIDQICNILYKHIKAHHGAFSKTLSPYPIKPSNKQASPPKQAFPLGLTLFTVGLILCAVFISLIFVLNTFSNKSYHQLLHVSNLIQQEYDV